MAKKKTDKLTIAHIVGYGCGDCGGCLCMVPIWYYMSRYLQVNLEINAALLGGDQTRGISEHADDAADNHQRYEVRHVRQRLAQALEGTAAQFIKQQRQQIGAGNPSAI